jgi:hypothetical protein
MVPIISEIIYPQCWMEAPPDILYFKLCVCLCVHISPDFVYTQNIGSVSAPTSQLSCEGRHFILIIVHIISIRPPEFLGHEVGLHIMSL